MGTGPSGRAIFQAHIDDLLPESVPIDLQWTLTGAVLQIQYPITLANGDNTLSIPTGTTMIVLKPPATNSNALKNKGAGGDTGWTLQPNQPNVFTYFGGNIVINSAGSTANVFIAYLA